MPIVVNNPSKGAQQTARLSIKEGGTGSNTAAGALAALDLYPANSIGQPNQLPPLNSNRKLDPQYLRNRQFSNIAIDGPATLTAGSKARYYITTYDVFKDYAVSADLGKVTLKEGYVEYEAPNKAGVAGFSINGRAISVLVTEATIRKPIVVSPYTPENVSLLYRLDPLNARQYTPLTLHSSLFFATGTNEPQQNSDWEVYLSIKTTVPPEQTTDLAGDIGDWTMLAYSYQSSTKTMLEIEGEGLAAHGERLVVAARVRHNTLNHQSVWSDFTYFKLSVSESSGSSTLPRPRITGVSVVNDTFGSPYPRIVPGFKIYLEDISPNSFHTKTEYKVFEGASEQPLTTVKFYPEQGTSLYNYTAKAYFKFNQLYTIQARYYREDIKEYTAWSAPYTVITGSSPDHSVEAFVTLHIYKESGQDGMDVEMSDEVLPVYSPMSKKGSMTLYTLDGLIRSHLPRTKHLSTQWQLSIYQDFIQIFYQTETTGELDRYAVTLNNVDFPAVGFDDYHNTPVFARCRYQDAQGIWSNWSPSTSYSRITF